MAVDLKDFRGQKHLPYLSQGANKWFLKHAVYDFASNKARLDIWNNKKGVFKGKSSFMVSQELHLLGRMLRDYFSR